MTPWYHFLTNLGDCGGETAIRSIGRAALAIRGTHILIARAEIRRATLAVRAEKILFPEQKSADRGPAKNCMYNR